MQSKPNNKGGIMEIEISWVVCENDGTTEHKRIYQKEPQKLTMWIIEHLYNPSISYVNVRYGFASYKFVSRVWKGDIVSVALHRRIDEVLTKLKEIGRIYY
jgi:hypothetical protein